MTHQRQVILEEIKKDPSHPTADEIYERVRKRLPRISMERFTATSTFYPLAG